MIPLTKSTIFIVVAILVFIILRLPSLFEPHWYSDEGIFASIAYALEQGKKLYVDVYDNRFPGIYYLYKLAEPTNRLITIRLMNLAAGIISLLGIYALSKKLSLKKGVYVTVAMAIWLLGTPQFEANIAHNENFFLPFSIWAIWFALSAKPKYLFLAGVLFGFAFLVKFQPVFTFFGLIFFFLIENKHGVIKRIKKIIPLLLGFTSLFVLFSFLLFINGNLKEMIQFGFLNNISYARYYSNYGIGTDFKLGLIIIYLLSTIILSKTGKLASQAVLLITLFIFDYYAVIFPGRKYEHYLLQTVPSFSLILGYIIKTLSEKKLWKTRLILISFFLVSTFTVLYIFYQGVGTPIKMNIIAYYREFLFFIQGKPVQNNLLPFSFGSESKKLQALLNIKKKYNTNNIYFHTNESWIYDLVYINPPTFFVAAYHQYLVPDGEKRLINDLMTSQPKVIVVDKNQELSKKLKEYIKQYYFLDREDKYFTYYLVKDSFSISN